MKNREPNREENRGGEGRSDSDRSMSDSGRRGTSEGRSDSGFSSSDRDRSQGRVVPEPRRHDEISGSRLSSADRGSNRNSEEESRLGRSSSERDTSDSGRDKGRRS